MAFTVHIIHSLIWLLIFVPSLPASLHKQSFLDSTHPFSLCMPFCVLLACLFVSGCQFCSFGVVLVCPSISSCAVCMDGPTHSMMAAILTRFCIRPALPCPVCLCCVDSFAIVGRMGAIVFRCPLSCVVFGTSQRFLTYPPPYCLPGWDHDRGSFLSRMRPEHTHAMPCHAAPPTEHTHPSIQMFTLHTPTLPFLFPA